MYVGQDRWPREEVNQTLKLRWNGILLPNKQYLSPDGFIDDWKLLIVNAEKYVCEQI